MLVTPQQNGYSKRHNQTLMYLLNNVLSKVVQNNPFEFETLACLGLVDRSKNIQFERKEAG